MEVDENMEQSLSTLYTFSQCHFSWIKQILCRTRNTRYTGAKNRKSERESYVFEKDHTRHIGFLYFIFAANMLKLQRQIDKAHITLKGIPKRQIGKCMLAPTQWRLN